MMNKIVLFTKNIIKTNFVLFYMIISISLDFVYADNYIDTKQKSLDEIDSEIISLEKKLRTEINSIESSEQKINVIKAKLEKERIKISNNRYKKEEKEKLLNEATFILDSLNEDLGQVENNKADVENLINKLNINKKTIDYKIEVINDSINVINQKMIKTSDELDVIKKKTKSLIIETLSLKPPSEVEFMLESENWDMFIVNSSLYELLIENQKIAFNDLANQYEKINQIRIKDSLNKENLFLDSNRLNSQLIDYNKQLNNFINYKQKLDDLIDEKTALKNDLKDEYIKIGLVLDSAKTKILVFEKDLNQLNKKNITSLEQQEKIKSQIMIKEKARQSIRKEILKLIETSKLFEGLEIQKLKGKLPWPLDGNVITKFGKRTNPETKVTIDYDLIEIQPVMTKEEQIIYLSKQIDPNNPNKSIVKKFQKISMNLKNGDRGYGVFGPQTTKMWKKYNKMSLGASEQPIFSIYDGVVESINFINPIVGVVIIIRHDNDYFSVYNGNIEVLVMKGSKVKTNQKIGTIKKQNILSFQLWKNNNPINPENWFIKK
ncbi:MAG: hypothetical protein CMF87_04860 [Candidatus Marinimicrobia bacterium]|nr:hypothetical protein [Candidatus Neomarinimicrobiota bacterium]